eukprot:5704394-Alexandrium_andersonii.AAC.1
MSGLDLAALSLFPGPTLLDTFCRAGATLAPRAALLLYGAAVALWARTAPMTVPHLPLDGGCLQLGPLAKALPPCLHLRQ